MEQPPYSNLEQRHDEGRRKELAAFLKKKRARVKPLDSGIMLIARRRTPGLRREEVAEMAGVSASWYTWLEQGRDIHPSPEFLTRLSRVLKLNPFELNHLFDLAGRTPPDSLVSNHEEVPPSLEHLVKEVLTVPAFVMGARSDFLLWNEQFKDQIQDLDRVPKDQRNVLSLIFDKKWTSRAVPDWEEKARTIVAEFRWSVGRQIGSPWVKSLVARMCEESPDFARLWNSHDVQERKKSRVFDVLSEKYGRRSFMRSIYVPAEAENLRLVVLTPV